MTSLCKGRAQPRLTMSKDAEALENNMMQIHSQVSAAVQTQSNSVPTPNKEVIPLIPTTCNALLGQCVESGFREVRLI